MIPNHSQPQPTRHRRYRRRHDRRRTTNHDIYHSAVFGKETAMRASVLFGHRRSIRAFNFSWFTQQQKAMKPGSIETKLIPSSCP
jgi:hypothetical protein